MTTDTLDTAGTPTDSGTQDALPPATEVAQGAPATASADTPPTAEGDSAAPAAIEYEPFAMPEGMTTDEEVLGEFKATAQELKLSQKDAQRLADIGVKMQMKQQEAYRKTQQEWIEQSKTDKEFGGEALKENLGIAKKAMEAFATPDLRKLLNESGLGNHPEVVRHFIRVGKAISEDGRVVTGSRSGLPADPAKRMFPNQA